MFSTSLFRHVLFEDTIKFNYEEYTDDASNKSSLPLWSLILLIALVLIIAAIVVIILFALRIRKLSSRR